MKLLQSSANSALPFRLTRLPVDSPGNMSLLSSTLPGSLMDDLFAHLAALTSYLSRKFIHFIGEDSTRLVNHSSLWCKEFWTGLDVLPAEDLALRDVTRTRKFSLPAGSSETGSSSSSGVSENSKGFCGDLFLVQRYPSWRSVIFLPHF